MVQKLLVAGCVLLMCKTTLAESPAVEGPPEETYPYEALEDALDGFDLSEHWTEYTRGLDNGKVRTDFPSFMEDGFKNKKAEGAAVAGVGTLLMLSAIPLYVAGYSKDQIGFRVGGNLVEAIGALLFIPGVVVAAKASKRMKKVQRYKRKHGLD